MSDDRYRRTARRTGGDHRVRTDGAGTSDASDGVDGPTGYRRGDGSIGVRDRVLVLPSVICSHVVADRIAERVDGAVSTPHDHGCAQLGADADQTERTLVNVARNPNVSGAVVVGLGCEEVQSGDVAAALEEFGVPVREVSIQDAGGTDECLEQGVDAAESLLAGERSGGTAGADGAHSPASADPTRVPIDLGDLTLGVVSGDLADSTVETADPLVGELAREVVAAGGRVVAAGVERPVAHPEEARAAATDGARPAVDALLDRHADRPAKVTRVRREAADRSYAETTRAWGELPVADVLSYGERATHDSGLALVDSPSEFATAATGLAAAGAHLVVHVTADGVPAGHPVVPVLKVTGDPTTAGALPDDVDVDASRVDAAGLRRAVKRVIAGDFCCAERHGLTQFAIDRVGPSV
ncbi:UxaA family hydrolase [Halobium salinum]|uniref:UxaA family hydrolase n=1 Tax=Halobium salinum TaxID=1364940 RepID=A0ABD5PI10_9EURY|nr:UxaA family hydrolase [Halobium salinum]